MAVILDEAGNSILDEAGFPITDESLGAAFPAGPLNLQAGLQLGGAWSDITGYLQMAGGVTAVSVSRGRPDEATQPTPQTAAVQLNNTDARFSVHNPGPYYPNLQRNTPLRVSVPDAGTHLRLEGDQASNFYTLSAAPLNLAGDLDARIDLNLSNWTASHLASKWSLAAGNFSWAFLLNADGTLAFWYTTDGSTAITATSAVPLPWPGGRTSLRATFTVLTQTVTFWYATSIGGTYAQLGAAVVASVSVAAIFAGNGSLRVGYHPYFAALTGYQGNFQTGASGLAPPAPPGITWAPSAYGGLNGKVYEFQLRNGINGPLVADPIFSSVSPGATSFPDAQGNTWSASGTAEITGRKYRYHGEVPEWPPRSDPTGKDAWVPVQASGQLRRAAQRTSPIQSPLRRAWARATGPYAPIAYWPGEDGPSSTRIASGLANGQPMNVTRGKPQFASSTAFACSAPIPALNNSSWYGKIPDYTQPANPANVTRFILSVPATGVTPGTDLVELYTWGTFGRLALSYATSGDGLRLTGFAFPDGGLLFDSGNVALPVKGVPLMAEMALTISGGTITWHLNTLNVLELTGGQGATGTISGTLGKGWAIGVSPNADEAGTAIGHIAFQSQYSPMDFSSGFPLLGPLSAWQGETAALRFARLCAEQGFASRVVGYPAASVPMGPQSIDTFANLLQECESADHGLIFEPRQALALGYRTSGSLCNQGSATSGALPLALSFASDHIAGGTLEPADDDQLIINDETVTRASKGSSYEAVLTAAQYAATSALSAQNPPAGVGAYQDSQTINVPYEGMLASQACWIVHTGTVNELRYPQIPVDLASSALSALFHPALDLDEGDFLQVTGGPAFIGPDAIRQLAWGLAEQLGVKTCLVQWSTRPESPYETLVAGTGAVSDPRYDTDGSTLHAGITAAAVSMLVDTAGSFPLWTTVAGDFPFDIVMGGERITVGAISGTSSPQTFSSLTRSVNGIVKAHVAGEAVNLFAPAYYALA